MERKQVFEILNTMAHEHLGESVVVQEDLSNIVDVGRQFEDSVGLDNYVRSLTNHIGKMVFRARVYEGRTPSVLRDGWEFGSILQKVSSEMPDATENESWQLRKGATYNQDVFTPPVVHEKLWNSSTTFEIDLSYTEKQVKESFDNAQQLNAFYSMIYTDVENRITLGTDNLIMRTTNNMIAETIYADFPGADYTTKSGTKAVNLLKLYNDSMNPSPALTKANCLNSPDFIRFATVTMSKYVNRLKCFTTLFNIGGRKRFTPSRLLHFTLLDDFASARTGYLMSDVYNKEELSLPNFETVPFWQGSGKSFAFADVSKIDVKTAGDEKHTVTLDGILGIMYDHDAIAVCNDDRRTKTHYNEKGEFWNDFHKVDCQYLNDYDENFIVFFVA